MKSKYLLILGSANNMLEDFVEIVKMLDSTYEVMAIGLDTVDKIDQRIDYVATYHPADVSMIYKNRQKVGNTDFQLVSHVAMIDGYDVNITIPFNQGGEKSGSSALLGVYAGQKLGYNKIILCGCPLVGTNSKNQDYKQFQLGWQKSQKLEKEKVRSMSGWTSGFLGKPDSSWLHD